MYEPTKGDLLPIPEQAKFLSWLGALAYLGQTREDIYVTVSQLAQKVYKTNSEDFARMRQLYAYVNGSSTIGITYAGDRTAPQLVCSADASFAENIDSKSQTGIVISFQPYRPSVADKSSASHPPSGVLPQSTHVSNETAPPSGVSRDVPEA